jgi:hypothetical protein
MATLIKEISDTDSVIMFTPDALIPEENGVIKIDSEIITYTNIYMGTMYGCTRGAQSTVAASHSAGSSISLVDFFSAPAGGSVTYPLLAPAGSAAAASYAFSDQVDMGLFNNNGGSPLGGLALAVDSTHQLLINGSGGASIRVTPANDGQLSLESYDSMTLQSGLVVGGAGLQLITSPNAFGVDLYAENCELVFNDVTHAMRFLVDSVESAKIDASAVAGDTRFMLYDVDTATLQRVSVGVADSGGVGYKVLRIPN